MNSFQSFALKGACAVLCAASLAGCGASSTGRAAYERGIAAYELKDFRNADEYFGKYLESNPDDVDAILYRARVKLDLGELPEAKALVETARNLDKKASDVAMLAAQIAWHLRDYQTAEAGFSALAANAKLSAEIRSEALAGLGVVETTANNLHLARVAFLEALRLDRRNAAAWYHLGLLYRDGFAYTDAALEQFEIFVRLETEASPRVQKVQRKIIPALKEAISHVLVDRPRAAQRNSAGCATMLNRAEASWKKGAFKEARKQYQEALAADSTSYPAALGLAKAWEKTDTTNAGQQKALENYKVACSLRPSAVSTYLAAASLAARLGYTSQAGEIYSRALAASPTNLEALDGLIRSLRKAGNRTKVAQAYQGYRDQLVLRGRKR